MLSAMMRHMVSGSGRRAAWRHVLFVVAVVLLGLTAPPRGAWAQSPEEAFKEGLAKFDQGDCDTALPLFVTAYEGTQSPNARLYVARCLVKLGRDVEAYEAMAGTLALAREKAETEDKYAKTRDAAAAELAQLEPKIGKLVVAFDEPYEDAVILLNGAEVAPDRQGVPIPVVPGDVQVTARAPGKREHVETVEVGGGQTKAVAIVLEDALVEEEEPSDEGPGLGTLRIVGIAVASAGVASMVVFAVTGSMAKSKFDEVDEACGSQTCPDGSNNDAIDSGKTMQTVANATLGVGLALMAGGAALIIFGGPDEDDASNEAGLELSPIVAPTLGGGMLGLSGRF